MAETGVRAQGWKGWPDTEVDAYYLVLIKGSLSSTPGGGSLGELSLLYLSTLYNGGRMTCTFSRVL